MYSYYDTLNVSVDSDIKEIKRAYVKLLWQFQPETNPEEFKKISEAYKFLINPDYRSDYDKYIKINNFSNKIISQNNFGNENIDLTSETNFNNVLLLVSNYCTSGNYQNAIDTLDSAIDKYNLYSSENIFYYIELINIYITTKNIACINESLYQIAKIVRFGGNKEISTFILDELNNIYLDLYKNRNYPYCKEFINKMIQMFPNETNLISAQNDINMLLNFKSSIHIFMNDSHILDCLKTLIKMWFTENITEQIENSMLDTYSNELNNANTFKLINSIKYLKKKYPYIYNIDNSYFEKLIKGSKRCSPHNQIYKSIKWTAVGVFFLHLLVHFYINPLLRNPQKNANVYVPVNYVKSNTSEFVNNAKGNTSTVNNIKDNTSTINNVKDNTDVNINSAKQNVPTIYVIQQPLKGLPKGYYIKDMNGVHILRINELTPDKITNPVFQSTYTNRTNDIKFDAYVVPEGESPYEILGNQIENSNNDSILKYYNDNNTQQLVYGRVIYDLNNTNNKNSSSAKNYYIYYRITTSANNGVSEDDLIKIQQDLNN